MTQEPDGWAPKMYSDIDRAIDLLMKCVKYGNLPEPLESDIEDFIEEVRQPDGQSVHED